MNIVPEGKRSGVLLVNTGTPTVPKPRAVRKYLAKFLMDKRIAPMNRAGWWFVLHLFILPKRGRASAEKYQKIWTDEGSPFTIAHQKLEAGLGAAFEDEGLDVAVRCAMSYSDPSVLDCVRELKGAGCTRLIVLPLYPQSAYSTTGSVSDSVERALKKARWNVPCDFVDNYHDDPTYIRAIAASIEHAGFKVDSDDKVLFSYHSIPLVDIEAGDTYELQTGATSLQVARELGIDRAVLARVVRIGLPAGLQSAVFSLANIVIQACINSLGTEVMAASSAVISLEYVVYNLLNSFSQACTTFVGQNFGAGNVRRCKRVLLVSLAEAEVAQLVMLAILLGLGHQIVAAFNPDPTVVSLGYLRICVLFPSYMFSMAYENMSGYLRGFGISLPPAIITALSVCGWRFFWVSVVFPASPTFLTLLAIYPISLGCTTLLVFAALMVIRPSKVYAQRTSAA